MPDAYDHLLDATIQHLRELKVRGARFVSVSEESLARLGRGGSRAAVKSVAASVPKAAVRQPPAAILSPTAETTRRTPHPNPLPFKRGEGEETRVASPVAPSEAPLALGLPGEPPIPSPAAAALSPEVKVAAFADLRQRASACVKCMHLASSRKNVVFGVGSIDAKLMFVGEAPGVDEDQQGEPFVGRAGQLLTKIIQTMGLTRETVYIANILKCRPDTPGQASGNRPPTADEMKTCIPYLHEQIDLIRPEVIVALGGVAVTGLLGKTAGIMRLRGNWQTYRGTPLMPTYHPAYLLRNQAPAEKRRVWEDMLQVMEKLGLPISERQRGFFKGGA